MYNDARLRITCALSQRIDIIHIYTEVEYNALTKDRIDVLLDSKDLTLSQPLHLDLVIPW